MTFGDRIIDYIYFTDTDVSISLVLNSKAMLVTDFLLCSVS